MILSALIGIPLLAGVLAWLLGRGSRQWPRIVSIAALAADLVLLVVVRLQAGSAAAAAHYPQFFLEVKYDWIPQLGITFHCAVDGLSWLLCLLTVGMGLAAVLVSWKEIQDHVGFFHFNLMGILAGILGVFLTVNLIAFFFFWELMLVPMYFLILIWGHEDRKRAAMKFFIFTQASGFLMLLSILALHVALRRSTGVSSFEYADFLGISLPPSTAMLIMLGFFVAFAVKLPVVPLHTWLPDAHTEAPTAGSVILAGLLLKTGAYGMLRFVIPLFPEAAASFAPAGMALGVVGILYGAVQAYSQDDFKRMVAYTSVSHLGFVLLGIFALNAAALQGVVIQIIAHAISTGALFMVAGYIKQRFHTRDMNRLGGLLSTVPLLAGVTLFFALASMGIPGTGNFIAEFLVTLGSYRASIVVCVIACLGIVFATVYALQMVQRVVHGPRDALLTGADLSRRELALMLVLAAATLCFGLYPHLILDPAQPVIQGLMELMQVGGGAR
jgi:NADH-quinone oxidoreductase subunit M